MMKDIDYIRRYMPEEQWNDGIRLLEEGIPVQYIVGNVDFFGNIINVNSNVLIPRFETELLVEKTIGYIRKIFDRSVKILDVGTGSGCIAIALKKSIECDVVGVDISNEALEVACGNALDNDADILFVYSDMLKNVNGSYDVIISNPPYIGYDEDIEDIVRDNEPSIALYASDDGLYYYREIISTCFKNLNDKFLICFEIGYNQGKEIIKIIREYFSDVEVVIEKDYSDRDRFVFIYKED